MANLNRLLEQRQAIRDRGQEIQRQGLVWSFSHTNVSGVQGYQPCCFHWTAPNTGYAVIELWGASGSGGRMCCCSGSGIPGNPGAYTRIGVNVTVASIVCGFVGCSPTGDAGLCYPGRSGCSQAQLFNTSCNNVIVAQGGFGGYTNCSTFTAHYCCLVAAGFCHTLRNTFCGTICNWGGPNSACAACASGGDVNICGGISCLRTWDCCQYWKCNHEMILAVSPGIYSATCSTCFNFFRSEWPGFGIANNGWAQTEAAVSFMNRRMPFNHFCVGSNQPCGCYEYDGCFLNPVGFPGLTGAPCPSVRSGGGKGGHGGVRITWYNI